MEFIRPDIGAQQRCHVIPSPNELENLDGDFVSTANFELCSEGNFPNLTVKLKKNFHFARTSSKHFVLKNNLQMAEEAYRIAVGEDLIEVEFATSKAGGYAIETLKQLQIGDFIPQVKINDYPAVKTRGFHTNLSSFRQTRAKDVLSFIDAFAKFKLNTYLIEYNERFPFVRHQRIRGANAFTPEDIAAIEHSCCEKKIQIIPLVQCIGHNEHIGRYSEYAKFFEPEAQASFPVQLCPLHDGSFQMFTELALEILEAHPGGKYLHIGGDETGSLGNCPRCAEFAARYGKAKLYSDYVNRVIEWVLQQGRTPIIWDDMLSHFPAAARSINRKTVIMCWDYWTTKAQTPLFVARHLGKGLIADKSWLESNFSKLDEPERTVVREYCQLVDVKSLLATLEAKEFAEKYLGNAIPQYFNAFPYVDYYRDLGFEVMGAPSTLGNSLDDIYGLPNYARFRCNIREFAEKTKRSGIQGMITSAWFNFPPEIIHLGIIDTAQNLWIDREPPNLHPRFYVLRKSQQIAKSK